MSSRTVRLEPNRPAAFVRRRALNALAPEEVEAFRWRYFTIGRDDQRRGWVMQLHIGALRSVTLGWTNSVGPNNGFDSIGMLGSCAARGLIGRRSIR